MTVIPAAERSTRQGACRPRGAVATAGPFSTFEEWDLDSLPRLKRLRKKLAAGRPEICIERTKFITAWLRKVDGGDQPMEIRYAEAQRFFMQNKEPLFFDDNLLAGTTTSKFIGAPVYPELTGMTIWPELDTISTRGKNPLILAPSDAVLLDLEIFPYWMKRNVLEVARQRFGSPSCMKLFERLIFFLAGKAGCVSHTVPHYSFALKHGVRRLIDLAAAKEREIHEKRRLAHADRERATFYRSVQIALAGTISYAKNLSKSALRLARTERDPQRRAELRALAEVCARVPAFGARSFREAVNSLWLLQVAVHAENINMAISPGRLDQILLPYYRHDVERGNLSAPEALELVGCLWLKFNDNTNVVPESAEQMFGGSGTVPAVTLGGVDEDGADAVNELTYLMLRVTELLQTRDPNVNARFHYEANSTAYRNRIAAVIASTRAVPAVHNDVADIATLVNQGVPEREARDFAIIGCVELAIAGRSYDASSSIIFNLPAVVELALYDGKRPQSRDAQIGPCTGDAATFTSFDDFMSAFRQQFAWLAGEAIRLNEMLASVHQDVLPSPLLSALFVGPMEKGRDLIRGGAVYNSSGATHVGFADTVDSLSAIEHAIFRERKYTMRQILEALAVDFSGHEELHAYLLHRTPKYGTRNPAASRIAQDLIHFIYEFYQGHTNYRGGRYRPAYWTMTNHAGQGRLCGALPNGRKAKQVFASGITPVSQVETDLTACLTAVAALDGLCIPGGEALNLRFPGIEDARDVDRLGATLESYCRLGGLHVQFNIVTSDLLLDAKKHPEKYPGLLVRVSGYSAYFNDLNDAMKDEIITRTVFDLRTGRSLGQPLDARHQTLAKASPSA